MKVFTILSLMHLLIGLGSAKCIKRPPKCILSPGGHIKPLSTVEHKPDLKCKRGLTLKEVMSNGKKRACCISADDEDVEAKVQNEKACQRLDDVIVDGRYVKTKCLIAGERSYQEAMTYCEENGLSLFKIENSGVQKALDNIQNKIVTGNGIINLWIGGLPNIASDSMDEYCISERKVKKEMLHVIYDTVCGARNWGLCEYYKP